MTKTKTQAFAGMMLAVTVGVGCAQPVDAPEAQGTLPDGVSAEARSDVKVVATLPVQSTGATVTLREIDGDEIAMFEEAPIGAPSMLDRLVGTQRATPLEVFMALAPRGEAAPDTLVRAHVRAVGAVSARQLALSDANSPGGLSPQGLTTLHHGDAECTLASDGAEFHTFWETLGWDYHWYNVFSAYGSTGWTGSGITSTTSTYRAHACNGGKQGSALANLPFSVVRQSGGACVGKVLLDSYMVHKDQRGIFYQSGAPVCHYQSWVQPQGTVGFPMRWAMGITAE